MRRITLVLLVACMAGELSKSVADSIMLCVAAFLALIGRLLRDHCDRALLDVDCITLAAIGHSTAHGHSRYQA
jgi:hypothetical protein